MNEEDAKVRLGALLGVMIETQGDDSEYVRDCKLGLDRIIKLEAEVKQLREEIEKRRLKILELYKLLEEK